MKKWLFAAMVLLLVVVVGTSITTTQMNVPEEKLAAVEEKIDYLLKQIMEKDADSSYEMFYPSVIQKEAWENTVIALSDYFPLKEDYTMKLDGSEITRNRSIISGYERIVLRHIITFDDRVFTLRTTWLNDKKGTGFLGFNVSNEADEATYQSSRNSK